MRQPTAAELQEGREEFRRAAMQGAATKRTVLQIQRRADAAFELHGEHAPPPLFGEDINRYRRRLLATLSSMSPEPYNSVNPWTQPDAALDGLEHGMIDRVVQEFEKPQGPLRMVTRLDEYSRMPRHLTFGDPEHVWAPFKGNVVRRVIGCCDNKGKPWEPHVVEMKMSDGSVRKQ